MGWVGLLLVWVFVGLTLIGLGWVKSVQIELGGLRALVDWVGLGTTSSNQL